MRPQTGTLEVVAGRIASRQHGVVTAASLLGAGLTREQVRRGARKGALIRVYPGVYRVGHRAPSVEADYIAAVLACGAGAALSGMAAAHLLGIVRGKAPPPEVTAPAGRRISGIRTIRARRDLHPAEVTTWRGIRVTTVPRTLVDLASHLPLDDLARACHEAGVRHHTTPRQVETVLARRRTAPGARKLRAVLRGEVRVTLSELERWFLARLEEAGLPLPQTNRPAGGRRVDCRWPQHHLTVELDSYRYHHSRHAWEQDRRREREAYARGDEFRRYTWGDVHETPGRMLTELCALLGNVSGDRGAE